MMSMAALASNISSALIIRASLYEIPENTSRQNHHRSLARSLYI
jgi:hypothetical protein